MSYCLEHRSKMLFDLIFFGFPLVLAVCLGVHAVRDQNPQFWLPTCSFSAYCLFYLVGGREVLLYLTVALMIGHGMTSLVPIGP